MRVPLDFVIGEKTSAQSLSTILSDVLVSPSRINFNIVYFIYRSITKIKCELEFFVVDDLKVFIIVS